MRIFFVASTSFHFFYGGGQVYVKNVVDELVRQDFLPIIGTPGQIGESKGTYNGCTTHQYDAI